MARAAAWRWCRAQEAGPRPVWFNGPSVAAHLWPFRSPPRPPLCCQDVLGHMLEFSLDQLGSRFIQQKLDTLTPEELEAAFAEIAPKAQMLMNDVFGNYVIQKFLELDVDTHRQDLMQQMKGSVSRPAASGATCQRLCRARCCSTQYCSLPQLLCPSRVVRPSCMYSPSPKLPAYMAASMAGRCCEQGHCCGAGG